MSIRYASGRTPGILLVAAMTAAAVPALAFEQIAAGAPTWIAQEGGDAFWIEIPDEFCDDATGSFGGLFRVDVGGGPVEDLTPMPPLCTFHPTMLLADPTWLYYPEDDIVGTFNIRKRWRGGGDPRPPLSTNLVGSVRAIAQDPYALYVVDSEGIKHVIKRADSATPTLLIADPLVAVGSLSVTEGVACCIAWTRSATGEVLQARKAVGATPTVLANGLVDPRHARLDPVDGAVYLAMEDGILARVREGAPVETLYDAAAIGRDGSRIRDIALDATHVYWVEDFGGVAGELRRIAKDGTGLTRIAAGLTPTTGISLDGDHVYLGQGSGVYRTRKDETAPVPNLSWLGMEVTQGIQDLANSVVHLQHKPTIVRAFPRSAPSGAGWVTAVLHGVTVPGRIPLPGTPLASVEDRIVVDDRDAIDRRHQSFTFQLPRSWTEGTVRLTAELNPLGSVVETSTADNRIPTNVGFYRLPRLCLEFYKVRAEGRIYRFGDPGFFEIVDRFESLLPHPRAEAFARGGTIEERVGSPSFELPQDKRKLIRKLRHRAMFRRSLGDRCAATHVVGMIHPAVDTGTLRGYGSAVVNSSFVKMTSDPAKSLNIPFYTPLAGSTMAQEVGHNYNGGPTLHSRWEHVDCGNPEGIYQGYPYDPCQIAPAFSHTTFWGFDPLSRVVVLPATEDPDDTSANSAAAKDYMSYGSPQWVSDHNWTGAVTRHGPFLPLPPAFASAAFAADPIYVRGSLDPDRGVGSLEATYRLPEGVLDAESVAELAEANAEADGSFRIELLDDAGAVLATHPLAILEASEEFPSADEDFTAVIPDDPDLARLRVVLGAAVIAERPVTANAPTVEVLEPLPGALVGDRLSAEWRGSDPDGDSLVYTVSYSHDAGSTWTTLEDDLPDGVPDGGATTRLDVDASELPGSSSSAPPGSSLLRIIASDGVNTAIASAGPFRVTGKPPFAHVVTPRDGTAFHHLDELVLRGRGVDLEDGELEDDAAFRWLVDGDLVANAQEARLPGLPPGTHHIALCVRDTDGLEGCESVEVTSVPGRRGDDGDGDGVPEGDDNCAAARNPDQEDADGDGVGDLCDVCPGDADPDQSDSDFDLIGDACDPCPDTAFNDDDGDGVCFALDNCPGTPNSDQSDRDGDGAGDACDRCADVFDPLQIDCDGDGIGDACVIAAGGGTDCNANETLDSCDIALARSPDVNRDGLPDECVIPVAIDVKPGSDHNPLNPSSRGVLPVALLGAADFDVADVDPTTLTLGPGGGAPAHDLTRGGIRAGHTRDVNEDGFADLFLHFQMSDAGIRAGDVEVCLEGATISGPLFAGCDAIRTVPRGRGRP